MSKKLNIAVIVSEFPALSETFILNRITGLLDRGHSVDIYASRERDFDDSIHQTVKDYQLQSKTSYERNTGLTFFNDIRRKVESLFFLIKKSGLKRFLFNLPSQKEIRYLTRFRKKKRYDVIHAFFGMNGNIALQARYFGILEGPIAISFHGFDLSSIIKENPNIYHRLFREADLFLPVCEYYKKRLIDMGCPDQKIKVHPSAIDVEQFTPAENNDSVSKVKIISIGRLVEKKGFKYSIQAVAEYIKENPAKEIMYRIIGAGPLQDKLQTLIDELQMSKYIDIWGSVNQAKIVSEIQSSDILICPSVVAENGDEDTVPNVLKEAMACRLPVIATWHGGIPELVQHKENGFLVEEKDVQALKEKIDELVNSPELRNRLGKNGREYVKNNYEIESWNDIISEEYIKLAQNYSER